MIKTVKTPCIGVCSTGIGDDVCRGCKRYGYEVIHWNAFTQEQKRAIIDRLDLLIKQVLSDKLHIIDIGLLLHTLKVQRIRFDEQAAPENSLFTLLKAGANQIQQPEQHGFRVLRAWQHVSLPELRDIIDADFYTLSSVHFERYFALQ